MEPTLDCRTPPTSPNPSRLVTKRRCPFGESPQQYKIPASESVVMAGNGVISHDRQDSDCAFEVLMESQRNQSKNDRSLFSHHATSNASSQCWICQQLGEAMPCAFCEHNICEMCVRQCDRCFGVFCTFCSTINYDNSKDQPLCLTCHQEASRKQRNRSSLSQRAPVKPSSVWSGAHQDMFSPVTA